MHNIHLATCCYIAGFQVQLFDLYIKQNLKIISQITIAFQITLIGNLGNCSEAIVIPLSFETLSRESSCGMLHAGVLVGGVC